MSPFQPHDFTSLLGTAGFSDLLLNNHFTLYQGYVTNVNKSMERLNTLSQEHQFTPEYAELKRRFGWEFNGMRLHELYFANMNKETSSPSDSGALMNLIKNQFGSYDAWLADFKATGTMRGIGWTILYQDPEEKKLFNTWIEEHDMGHLAMCKPLLVLDVFEHAYISDYGIKRADYINAFVEAIEWKTVEKRME